MTERTQAELERDLYRGLLELGEQDEATPFLEEALALVVRVAGARRGYLELGRGTREKLWLARGFDDDEIAHVRKELSTGIIARAIETAQVVSTASALDDPRFSAQGSVQAQQIRAVLCVPVGSPSLGVVYLQGRAEPGPFPERDQLLSTIFARHLARLADRLLADLGDRARRDHTAEQRARLAVEEVIGTSAALGRLFQGMLVAAPVEMSVLISGESGTGKTAVARALHRSSARRGGPFVELNCAALPGPLFESELFGAEKGAHSTADRRIDGKVHAAQGGTLFLDEIAEIPLESQGKLLTFLQSKSYYRLGKSTPESADVRIVAATNADLGERVASKRFREDLYYRLGALELHVPALSERREDIPAIADHIARLTGQTHGRELPLTHAAKLALSEAEWPGNVRQLENVVQRGWATASAAGAPAIEPRHLFGEASAAEAGSAASGLAYHDALRSFQTRFLREALDVTDWNVSEAARRLELSRSRLNELMRSLGLSRPGK
ncbi:MAG: sigma-54-dependent Fis family transcriptional regulator [Myxococcales bacterium]|nr:sigma-54-dependent Fis family transcriptional regulator [Myxococcales bacterium]